LQQFEEFVNIQRKFPLLQEMNEVIRKSYAGKMAGFKAKLVENSFRPDPGTLYYLGASL
jgi:hypothetical protein